MATYPTAIRVWTLGRIEMTRMVRRVNLTKRSAPQPTPSKTVSPTASDAALIVAGVGCWGRWLYPIGRAPYGCIGPVKLRGPSMQRGAA
jgi:hypothetical protein